MILFLLRAMHGEEVQFGTISHEGWIGDWCRNYIGYRAAKGLRGHPNVNGRVRRRSQLFIWFGSAEFRGCRHRGLAGSILFARQECVHTRGQRVTVAVLPAPSSPGMLKGGGESGYNHEMVGGVAVSAATRVGLAKKLCGLTNNEEGGELNTLFEAKDPSRKSPLCASSGGGSRFRHIQRASQRCRAGQVLVNHAG